MKPCSFCAYGLSFSSLLLGNVLINGNEETNLYFPLHEVPKSKYEVEDEYEEDEVLYEEI